MEDIREQQLFLTELLRKETGVDASVSRKIHDFIGFVVDENGARHGTWCTIVAIARMMAALAAVVLLLHQMVTRAERNQMSIVRRRGNRDTPRATHVRVAQLVRQLLQLVGRQSIVIPQNMVM